MRAVFNKVGGKMKKIRCIDCKYCIVLYLDCHGYLNNNCKNGGVMFYSLEKWYCDKFKATEYKAKICKIKGSDK